MKTVVVVCAGGRKRLHPNRLALVARFHSVHVGTREEGYVEQWEEAEVVTRRWHAEMDQALVDSPYWMPATPEGGPRQVATQWITEDGSPAPDSVEGGVEGMVYWQRRLAYRKFRLACPFPECTLDVQLHQDKMFAQLSGADTPEHGESRLLLNTLC